MDSLTQQLIARLRRTPDDAQAYEQLKARYREVNDLASLANLLQGWADNNRARHAPASDAYCEAAGCVLHSSGDRARAIHLYQQALALTPAHPAATAGLTELRAEQVNAGATVELEQRIAVEQDPLERVGLLMQLAEQKSEQQHDLDGAIVTLRKALALVPGDVQVMHQLATLLLRRAEASEGERASADHRRVAELFYQIAQGVEQGVDVERAIEYLTAALDAVPEHDGALALLERLAPTQGRDDLLPGYWVRYLAAAGEGPESDQRRLYLGEAYLGAGQLDDALYCLKPVAEHGNEQANELLQRVYALQARAGAAPATGTAELPPARPEAAPEDPKLAERNARVAPLRRQVHELLANRQHDEVAELCREILELDPTDPEAFSVLESHYRKRRDHAELRNLLLASTRVPGLSVDARKLRLREVATLSESKLRDSAAALSAWRGVVTLDPADRDATRSLKRLLKKAERWDELASVLEREALATTAPDDKAALIREIALIHRDKRKDQGEAADAFRQLHALKPDDQTVADELLSICLELERWEDAAPLIREKLDASSDAIEQRELTLMLAQMLHERLDEHEAAYALCERALALPEADAELLARMERIDQQTGNHARLLQTLERLAERASGSDRAAAYLRMGVVAEEALNDVERAAECFGKALDLAPDNAEALSRLTGMFEHTGRYGELVELLRERSVLERDPQRRAALLRRMGATLAEHLDDQRGAAEAYERVLEIEEDEHALRYLRTIAAADDAPEKLAEILRRLAKVAGEPDERRDILFELATTLDERLDRPRDAAACLRRLVEEIDPAFEPAIAELERLCERLGDDEGLALALQRQLALAGAPERRLPLSRKLSDLYEQRLERPAAAIEVLLQWSRDDERDPEPHRRLRELLPGEGRFLDLVRSLDALAIWEEELDARVQAALEAGRTAFARLGDAEGAWRRLEPLVAQGNDEAERLLREVASGGGLDLRLAGLYVRLAQESDEKALSARYWQQASLVYEQRLGQPSQALEAALRRLAIDLTDSAALDEVDRLSLQVGAFARLGKVYERLLGQAPQTEDKLRLLRRQAALLEGPQPEAALACVLQACALDPKDEQLLERAEQLALRCKRSEQLLAVYERRIVDEGEPADRVRAAIRAAKLCDSALSERERASGYLRAALTADPASDELGAQLFDAAAELDAARPELGSDSARRELIGAHLQVAERTDAISGVPIILRAARALRERLDDARGAFDVLRQGTSAFPTSEALYDALLSSARRLKRLDALDAHLSRLIDDAIDSETTVALLRRRGRLLEKPLNRYPDAAGVYMKLLQLDPNDSQAAQRLRRNLRRCGRYQDLLLAISKQLQRTEETQQRLPLLREAALTWERDLKNRWEALDAWKAVLNVDPEDARALSAVARLERGRGSTPELDPQAYEDEGDYAYDDQEEEQDDYAELDGDEEVDGHADGAHEHAREQTGSGSAQLPGGLAPNASPEWRAGPADQEPEVDEAGNASEADLASLDADLSEGGAGIEELDLLDELAEPGIEVELDESRPARASTPPPLPNTAKSAAAPPPVPSASARPAAKRGSTPPVPPGVKSSPPPPLPSRARKQG